MIGPMACHSCVAIRLERVDWPCASAKTSFAVIVYVDLGTGLPMQRLCTYATCMLLLMVCQLSLKVILQYRYMHHPVQSVSQSKCTCKLPNSLELLVKGCEMSLPL